MVDDSSNELESGMTRKKNWVWPFSFFFLPRHDINIPCNCSFLRHGPASIFYYIFFFPMSQKTSYRDPSTVEYSELALISNIFFSLEYLFMNCYFHYFQVPSYDPGFDVLCIHNLPSVQKTNQCCQGKGVSFFFIWQGLYGPGVTS